MKMGGTNSPGIGGTRRIATGIDTVAGSSKSESTPSESEPENESEVEAMDALEVDVRRDMTVMNILQGDRTFWGSVHLPSM